MGKCSELHADMEAARATRDFAAEMAAIWDKTLPPSLAADAPELLAALRHLSLEVQGAWSLREPSIREAIGNTNYNCVQLRLDEALAVIERASGTVSRTEDQSNPARGE